VPDQEHRHIGEHDWHSRQYVEEWIAGDVMRDDARRPLIRQMLSLAPYPREAELRVIDVGAGYGFVTREVLEVFPQARVTLQDYSAQMFEQARRRLVGFEDRVAYVTCDLRDPAWTRRVGGPFDLAVSAIAIHNLRDPELIAACYRAIFTTLKPDGVFLNCDLVALAGGAERHLEWLRQAGFRRVECAWENPPLAIIAAYVGER
jgi:SAM-dependent methyltransferase